MNAPDRKTSPRDDQERQSALGRLRQVDLALERRRERQTLYTWLDGVAHAEEGRRLVISGAVGSGKGQLLRKALHRSHNRNLFLVPADTDTLRGPYGLFRSWIESILSADLPAAVEQELRGLVRTRHFLSLLTGMTGDAPTSPDWRLETRTHGDDRKAELAADLVRFFGIASRHRPLALAAVGEERLDADTLEMVARLAPGLTRHPIGWLVTRTESADRVSEAPAVPGCETALLRLRPLDTLQIQGVIRQIFRRHRIDDAFLGQLAENTEGNAARILNTLWYLIDSETLTWTRRGWAAPDEFPVRSVPADLDRHIADRLVSLSRDTEVLLKGLSLAGPYLDLPKILDLLEWSRSRFAAVRDAVNEVYPIFHTTEPEISGFLYAPVLDAVGAGASDLERASWSHRAAVRLSDTEGPLLNREIAVAYAAGGRAEAALTYRIAAAHRARSVASFGRAVEDLEHALKLCADGSRLSARLLVRLADIRLLSGNADAARRAVSDAVTIAKRAGALKLEADAKRVLAGLEASEGRYADALVLLDRCLALYRAEGRVDGRLAVLGKMAAIYRTLRLWPQTDAVSGEMLALAEKQGDDARIVAARVGAAVSAALRGHRAPAAGHLYRALRSCRRNGHWDLVTCALIDFADAVSAGGDASDLERYYLAAVSSARRRFDELRELEALLKLAESCLRAGGISQAEVAAGEVARLAETRGAAAFRCEAARIGAVCEWKRGRNATPLFEEALEIAKETGDDAARARVLVDRGHALADGAPDAAMDAWREARQLFLDLGRSDRVLELDRVLIRHAYVKKEDALNRLAEAV